jgi:hypothetical protein
MSRAFPMLFGFTLGVVVSGTVAVANTPFLDQAAGFIGAAQTELAVLDRDLNLVPDRALRRRLELTLDRARTHVDGAASVVATAAARPVRPQPAPQPPPVVVVRPPRPPPGPVGPPPLAPAEVMQIRAAMDAATFSSDQLSLLSTATAGRALLTADAMQLCNVLTFDNDKVECLARLFPMVVDPHNWWQTYGMLTFSSSRDALRSRTQ